MAGRFQLVALPIEKFRSFLTLSDEGLKAHRIRRLFVDEQPGYPCRVSLTDAEVGERVLLLPFTFHDVDSPYRASGPIFVRELARTATPEVNEIPPMLRSRLLSVRAYDSAAMLVSADVVEGTALEERIQQFFADKHVQYLHVHNARPGCYNCRVERA